MAIPEVLKQLVHRLGLAVLVGCLLLGGLHADWDFAQISRRAEQLYGPCSCTGRSAPDRGASMPGSV